MSQAYASFVIGVEESHAGPTAGRQPDQERPVPAEVVSPRLHARVEQPDHSPRFGINGREVRSFLSIALRTTQRQVLQVVIGLVLARKDMVYVEGRLICGLGKQAVFAPVGGASDDQGTCGWVNQVDYAAEGRWLSARRALDFQSDRRSATAI